MAQAHVFFTEMDRDSRLECATLRIRQWAHPAVHFVPTRTTNPLDVTTSGGMAKPNKWLITGEAARAYENWEGTAIGVAFENLEYDTQMDI
jgi:hypothetical protein